MYKALVQAVLLYGGKSWVVTDIIMTVLEGFHYGIARRIEEMTERKGDVRELELASVNADLKVTGICKIWGT